MPNVELKFGDCLEVMKEMEDNSIDTVITDPPYGLSKEPDMAEVLSHWLIGDDYEHRGGGFMGKSWDSFVPGPSVWKEVYRVMKPGACLMAFGGTRTNDLLSIAIRLAGFRKFDEIDYYYGGLSPQIAWITGQGFPKSLNISKKLDLKVPAAPNRRAISYRETIPAETDQLSKWHVQAGLRKHQGSLDRVEKQEHITTSKEPATDAAALWEGYGTALKPAHEVILCFYKPRDGTYANNALTWDVAGLWVDGARVGYQSDSDKASATPQGECTARSGRLAGKNQGGGTRGTFERPEQKGRWPANLILSHTPECRLVGMKKVDGYQINRWDDGAKPFGGGAGHPYITEDRSDEEGKETVESWECAPNCPIRLLDEQSGERPVSGAAKTGRPAQYSKERSGVTTFDAQKGNGPLHNDTGGASRFFLNLSVDKTDRQRFLYCAKSSSSERNKGCADLYWKRDGKGFVQVSKEEWSSLSPKKRAEGNVHVTVKPLSLLRYLARLTMTPTGGIVLDPFMGSGSTGIACIEEDRSFIGIEIEEVSYIIAEARIEKVWSETEEEGEA